MSPKFFRFFQYLLVRTRPFISGVAALLVMIALVANIYFGQFNNQWLLFLAGILVAALLAEATRLSRAEWIAMRRTTQLSTLKNKLDQEIHLREQLESQLATYKPRVHLIDEVLPIMIALVDIEGICRYHNHAFLDFLHLRAVQVNGKHLREILGQKIYQEIATANRKSLDGHIVQYERTQTMPDGAVYKLAVQHLPQFSNEGKVTGFYMLMSDITEPSDIRNPAKPIQYLATIPPGASVQNLFIDSFSEQVIGEKDAANRIMTAIEKGEFRLFSQQIRPLGNAQVAHYEILIRLIEEEESMMPPGAFFPLAERYGLMPHLDRWVVRHVIRWIAQHPQPKGTIFFLNVADSTIADVGFPEFLQCALLEYNLPGYMICFEVPDAELAIHRDQVVEFARRIHQYDCNIALSGFGRLKVLFEQIDGFYVEFLKIDGSIVLEILRDPIALAKARAIQHVAQEIGVKTIAEFVERAEIISQLTELRIDFAQGFGIAQPAPLDELSEHTPV